MRVVFPFAQEGAGFEAAGTDVDLAGGDGVQEAVVVDRQCPRRRGRHVLAEAHDRPGRVQETDLGGLDLVFLSRRTSW